VSLASAKLTIVISAIVPTRHQTSVARVGDIDTPARLQRRWLWGGCA
jgi:hypothetical protein